MTEQEIVNGVKNHDRQAMHEMYGLLAGYAMATAKRYLTSDDDCHDVLQECFLRAFSRIDDFDYRGEGSLRAWMMRIVANESINVLKLRSRITFTDEFNEDIVDSSPDVTQVPPGEINRMIASLPTGYRIVFNQFVFEHKSHKEIAQTLGIKENSSASQLLRAKRLLAKMINDYKRRHDE